MTKTVRIRQRYSSISWEVLNRIQYKEFDKSRIRKRVDLQKDPSCLFPVYTNLVSVLPERT